MSWPLVAVSMLAVAGAAGTPPQMAPRPTIGALPAVRAGKPVSFTLKNGLEVIAVPRHAAPIVAMELVIRTGADADPADRAGLASATADMLDEGTGDRSALDIARDLEQLGADMWLAAGRDGSQLFLQAPSAAFDKALAVVSDVLVAPRFAEADWKRVQNDHLTGLQRRRDQREAVVQVVADRVLYGDQHPYGRPVEGYERSVAAIDAAALRAFFETYWRPNNAALIVAGDFDPETLRPRIEKALGTWAPGTVPAAPEPLPSPEKRRRLVLVEKPGTGQSVIRLVLPGFPRTAPERPGLQALATVLGGTYTSRLNTNLREQKGYTYGARAAFTFLRRPGSFTASASVFTEVTDSSLTEFLKELQRLRADPVTPQELAKARATLQQRIAEAQASAVGTVQLYAELALYRLPLDEPVRFAAALAKLNAAGLKALAAQAIDPDGAVIVIVGDRAAIEPRLKALGLPKPEVRNPDGETLVDEVVGKAAGRPPGLER